MSSRRLRPRRSGAPCGRCRSTGWRCPPVPGELLDGTDYDTVEVGDEVSPNADFGVRIAGDSMEPRFVHGQIVWVHRQETLRSGEIGVFLYNGAGYCKRFERAPGRVELVSLNPRYAPIRVAEGDELRVFGRVVG